MELRLVEFPVPIGFDSTYATIDIDSNSVTFNLNDEVMITYMIIMVPTE